MGTADNTRSLIVHVFEDMLRLMPINNITVLKLMEACGLSRKSFYRYFNDIWDLILLSLIHI